MSSSFTSEHPESDVSTDQLSVHEFVDDDLAILLELTPDANARYTSVEGWSVLTQEAQNAVKLRYTDPTNWNEPIQHTCDSDHCTTYVCNYCCKYVVSVPKTVKQSNRADTFHRMHKRSCAKSNSNQIKDLTIRAQSLTDTIQSLQLENDRLN